MAKQISPSIRRLVSLMDTRYTVPGTGARFGLDAVLGLIPGIGDFLGVVIGFAVVAEAVRHRLPAMVIARMLWNLWIDGVIGAVPVFGDLWDFYFKANRRNLQLLEKHV